MITDANVNILTFNISRTLIMAYSRYR